MASAGEPTAQKRLILGSASPARRELLARLAPDFRVMPADVDESPLPGEPTRALAARLAREKAQAVAARAGRDEQDICVIGADQVAECDGRVLGKPGNAAANVEMLVRLSGREVHFFTAVHIIDAGFAAPRMHVDHTTVAFRTLSRDEVTAYVAADRPWHCAGGFMVERAGIALFRRVTSEDPTALIGLPLIFTAEALRAAGFEALPPRADGG